MKAPIVLAVDTQDLETAKKWVSLTSDSVSVFKLGLEFFLNFGSDGVEAIKAETDADIFLDLKLHDIPNTVGAAAQAVSHIAPRFLTVHASGGRAMVVAAVASLPKTDVTAVTILTSLSEEDLFEIGFAQKPLESAVALADLSVRAGARAIVCSPLEISAIRKHVGSEPIIITPGVRPVDSQGGDDQVRTMTPQQAMNEGANFVVIGRPITQSWKDGAQALSQRARAIADDILAR